MALAAGTRIGPYEIATLLGEGGMGAVYRARDVALNRDVAIKLLPGAFAADAERLARFTREAQTLAALNHPHIAQVFAIEEAPSTDGTGVSRGIVMELVDGEDLADVIARGPLPMDDALAIARQVLDALDTAHERGIVHRDLKPANIMIGPDGAVKVLDFGLAKAMTGAAGAAGPPAAAGVTGAAVAETSPALTMQGMILGTPAYMSPEQARGRTVDRRTDLWAFGCVLFEMLAGRRVFAGDDLTETLANVLKAAAPLGDLPASVPPRVRQVIAACLQKDPRARLGSAQDARLLLDGVFESAASPSGPAAPIDPTWRRLVPYAVGALAATVIVGLVAWRLAPTAPPLQVSRFSVSLPEGLEFRNIGRHVVSVAPDGSAMVYNAVDGLRLRRFSELDAHVIPGTEASLTNPVFSPDGQHVAFYSTADNQVKRLATAGGVALVIARNVDNPFGMHWAENGTILLALRDGIARVPDTGGTPELIVKTAGNERAALPQLLPDADAVLFTLATSKENALDETYRLEVVAQSLRSGQRKKVLDGARDAKVLPTGHLVYAIDGSLFAVAFDRATLTTRGTPIELVQGIWWRRTLALAANWSVSGNGTLIYAPHVPPEAPRPTWVSREGATAPAQHVPSGQAPRLSPDGKRLLVEIDNDVWIYELDTGRRKRLTSDNASGRPTWDPTGTRIAYTSTRSGSGGEVWVANADGTGTPRQLTDLPGVAHVDSWSPDGKTLAFHHHPPGAAPNEILAISPDDPSAKPRPLVQGGFPAEDAVFSPDGRYVAYLSAESGGREIYVRAFPGPGPQVPVSVGGGREPVWGRTGEIFYRSPTGTEMMAVKVTTTPTLSVGVPTRLFEGNYFIQPPTGSPRPQYDVTADGRRFLLLQRDRPPTAQIVVVQHWFEELRRVLPLE